MLAPPVSARLVARVVLVPKPDGVRRLTLLVPLAAAAYGEAVGGVASGIEARLGPGVFANRVARPSPLALEPWQAARARFRRNAVRLAETAGALVLADVRECYAGIGGGVVGEGLLRIGCDPSAVVRITTLLDGFAGEGVHGLPVGPEPSAVLANAVLSGADEALAADGTVHLRWVDDFVLAARDAADADRKLERLRAALARTGLELNERKTKVIRDRALARAALLSGPLSEVRPAYNRPSDAHALSSLAGPNLLPPPGRGVDPHRRAPRPAGGRR